MTASTTRITPCAGIRVRISWYEKECRTSLFLPKHLHLTFSLHRNCDQANLTSLLSQSGIEPKPGKRYLVNMFGSLSLIKDVAIGSWFSLYRYWRGSLHRIDVNALTFNIPPYVV